MNSLKRFLLAAMILAPSFASAAIVSQAVMINQSGSFFSVAMTGVQSFNSSLGALNKVSIGVSGSVTLSGTYAENMVWGPPAASIPYPVSFTVSHSLSGLFGLDGFGFADPVHFLFSAVATGVPGESYALAKDFSYGIVFDDTSELLGFTLAKNVNGVTPPSMISGDRDDFANDDLLLLSQLLTEDQSGMPNFPLTTLNAMLSITYDYTPREDSGGNEIPEPTTLLLLAVGILVLALVVRRKVRNLPLHDRRRRLRKR